MKGLLSRDFGLLVVGQVVSVAGSAVLRFALDLYVLDITGRADIFALVLALSTLPGIVFSPVGGAIADRFPKRDLMVGHEKDYPAVSPMPRFGLALAGEGFGSRFSRHWVWVVPSV